MGFFVFVFLFVFRREGEEKREKREERRKGQNGKDLTHQAHLLSSPPPRRSSRDNGTREVSTVSPAVVQSSVFGLD